MTPLLSYYGDDFTGSTDVMEALALHGVETVLFTRIPTAAQLASFASCQAIGLAGTSRSQSPEWMDENLPPVFGWLKSLQARFCHYKVCSTFDSAPHTGSIGRAVDIGATLFEQPLVPLVVGAPQLKRYTFAGHLFAGYQGAVYRIDRHPVMSRHPVTPMLEADLRLHLAQQTARDTVLLQEEWPDAGVVLLDVHDEQTQLAAGKRLLSLPAQARPFIVGSSGVEYAVMKALLERSEIAGKADFPPLAAVAQTMVVSGSVSPTTERQIKCAETQGFNAIPVNAVALARGGKQAQQQAISTALQCLADGRSPLIHTALGPGSDAGEQLNTIAGGRANIGAGLGAILRAVVQQAKLRRVIVAGGDSSSHALGELDIYALTPRMPLPATPGSPLCTASSGSPHLDGIEIALKGGQVGGDNYFVGLRDGRT